MNNRDQDSTSPIEEGSTEFSNLSDSISEYEPVSVPSEINRINRLQNQFRIDNNRNPRNEVSPTISPVHILTLSSIGYYV